MGSIRIDSNQLISVLQNSEARAHVAIRMYCEEGAKKFQNYAKHNRPWTDRTGHARQRLIGYVEEHGTKIKICIAHGVDYGPKLEYGHERRYSILEPTVKAEGPAVMRSFKTLLRRVFNG